MSIREGAADGTYLVVRDVDWLVGVAGLHRGVVQVFRVTVHTRVFSIH